MTKGLTYTSPPATGFTGFFRGESGEDGDDNLKTAEPGLASIPIPRAQKQGFERLYRGIYLLNAEDVAPGGDLKIDVLGGYGRFKIWVLS